MGITVVQRELTWTQFLCKISLLLRSKQSALWAMWKWWIYGKIRQKVNYMSSEKSLGIDAVGTDYVQQHQQNLCNQWTKFQVAFYCLVPFFLLWWQYEPKGLPGRKEVKPGPDWRSNHKHKHYHACACKDGLDISKSRKLKNIETLHSSYAYGYATVVLFRA